jgi:hypothetical protein
MRSTLLVYFAALCLLVGSASIAPPLDEVLSPPALRPSPARERPSEPGVAFLLAHAPKLSAQCDASCCVAPFALHMKP